MRLILRRQPGKSRLRFIVEVGGKPVDAGEVDLSTDKQREAFAAAKKVPLDIVRKLATELTVGTGDEASASVEGSETPAATPSKKCVVSVRSITDTKDKAVPYFGDTPLEAFRSALNESVGLPLVEPVIEWRGREGLCALDIDFHNVPFQYRPTPAEVDRRLGLIVPKPAFGWSTHGRGVRLIFGAIGDLSAVEWASVAAISARNFWPAADLELNDETRHPLYPRTRGDVMQTCGPVRDVGQEADPTPVRRLFEVRVADPEKVEAWLSERGFVRGRKYAHSLCPIAPSESGKRDPVWIGDEGVYCYHCSATKGRGFVSYARLCGETVDEFLTYCVKNFCHWTHAKHVVSAVTGAPELIADQLYRSCLHVYHGEDPRVEACLAAGERVLRIDKTWATPDGEFYASPRRAILGSLPSTWFHDGKKWKPESMRVEQFEQPHDLTPLGYPSINRIWAVRIWSQFLTMPDQKAIYNVFPTREYQPPYVEPFRPRYLFPTERKLDEDAAWQRLEDFLPGLNRKAVELLICAKGVVEAGFGVYPLIGLTGPTGASKTATLQVAAMICGDHVSENLYTPNRERLWQALTSAKESGSFCVFNEILKEGKNGGHDNAAEAFDFFLNVTAESQGHKMYVGQVRLGTPPVLAWTDTELPETVAYDSQLGRRMVHVHLPRQVVWDKPLIESGIGRLDRIRLHSLHYAEACNVILSAIIDRHFVTPRRFADIAKTLGFPTLLERREQEAYGPLRDLFDLVAGMPDIAPGTADKRRWGAAGWKLVDLGTETPLALAWKDLADSDGRSSRKCSSEDWSKILGVSYPVVMELRHHGRKLAIRFVGRHPDDTEPRYNGEILGRNPVELGSERNADIPGRRDSIDGGPNGSRPESLSLGSDHEATLSRMFDR